MLRYYCQKILSLLQLNVAAGATFGKAQIKFAEYLLQELVSGTTKLALTRGVQNEESHKNHSVIILRVKLEEQNF